MQPVLMLFLYGISEKPGGWNGVVVCYSLFYTKLCTSKIRLKHGYIIISKSPFTMFVTDVLSFYEAIKIE